MKRYTFKWRDDLKLNTVFDNKFNRFLSLDETIAHLNGDVNACEPPAVEEKDENSFVRDGVRYVATDVFAGTGCAKCDLHIGYGCRHPAGQRSCTREGNVYIVWKRAAQPRAMTSVEIAKRYGKGGYAFRYSDKGYFHTVYHNTVSLQGICLIDDLCEDVSRSPWFMPMVDESGTVTEQRV